MMGWFLREGKVGCHRGAVDSKRGAGGTGGENGEERLLGGVGESW